MTILNLKNRLIFFVAIGLLMFVFSGDVFAATCYAPGGCPNVVVPDNISGLSNRTFEDVLISILNWLLGIIGVVALISFAVSGIMYLVSTGNEEMVKKAKSGVKYSIIGMIVALGSIVAIQFIDSMLNATL